MVSIFGFPVEAIPLLTVITTITDIPNTVLNTTGNTVSSMLVARLVEGKNWLKDEVTNLKKVG
ncbi:sodium:dicarboxylate symporter [[Clostridium] sordellii]|uniref:Dicarboxylate symporter family protein n=1 Tax=Paraclostridium sordellii TaxID=1505 RepID=A0A0A1SGK9_PARSO|nr:amino acid:proton symporter [Paeniclostridium sordellii]CEJ72612.1 dicarboxylate symporter family protein [[Clostridium] sordellii] [Paeniclostridium sordellii]CEK31059.1 sodium:dicarboxylate symporter [[Clostridium] sordellii] [Paeniclostridium sordellii]CEK34709.1 sodium:dicarboxylate symporter,Sodium:dicarboxylate symporter family [[Clostridium] sordellii] [Paeniclostridium sordellii]CEN68165.1 sodium:dicarboxylate symporter [[Clostridium] sordellii] [Paeniclostridium sordellii]